jgi:D-threonine aldolase
MKDWYHISNIDEIDSPVLVIYKERVVENINRLAESIDDISRLRPHIKTHKSPHITEMMLRAGISKFKCATIAEAEMLAAAGAKDILLAYQPVGPKATRFFELTVRFPDVKFACLLDNEITANELSKEFIAEKRIARVFIDLNVGMNRTGIAPENGFELFRHCSSLRGIQPVGLHVYDGHIRDEDFNTRKQRCDGSFSRVTALQMQCEKELSLKLIIVAGGTPTYSVHAKRKNIECSPGTFIYWDKGYENILHEQKYLHAAVVVTRIISKPSAGVVCIDLGHKSIASENPLDQRVYFLNADDVSPVAHSEEHMVLRTQDDTSHHVGDVLYGVPFHVCPTIALYERTAVVEGGKVTDWWMTTSRNRKITV